jgi:hypothetical protein
MQEYTFADIVSRVKQKLNDEAYDETQIKQWVNDVLFEVLGEDKYKFLEKVDEPVEGRGGELSLPRDYQTTIHLTARELKNRSNVHELSYVPPRDWVGAMGFTYTVIADQVLFRLGSAGLSKYDGNRKLYKLRHYYLAKPKRLVEDKDKPPIPYEYSEILVLGALKRAEQRRDNFDQAAIYENERLSLVENMKMRYGPRQFDGGNRARLPYGQVMRGW